MARPDSDDSRKKECIRLRSEEFLSYGEIRARIGKISNATLSMWLRDIPLPEEERRKKWNGGRGIPRAPRRPDSKFLCWANLNTMSRREKAGAAKAAVMLRLYLAGLTPYWPDVEGSREDFLIVKEGYNRTARLQVKNALSQRSRISGLRYRPTISIVCNEGHNSTRKYRETDMDFIVGYDITTDDAYVFAFAEAVKNANRITVTESALERWDKISDFIMRK